MAESEQRVDDNHLEDLDSFLASEPDNSSPAESPNLPLNPDEDFSDLESLLDVPDNSANQVTAAATPAVKPSEKKPAVKSNFEETMRVSVKQLDGLNNLIGDLVVKRNQLEADQSRIRQFIENLLSRVQQLNEVGGRMHELYEKSLLEGALLASRQQQGNAPASLAQSNQTDDGLSALEMDQFTGFHLLSQEIIELIVRIRESVSDIQFVVDGSDEVAQNLRQVTSQLQDGINKTRMVPFAQTADRLPRAVRDIATKLNKQASLEIKGKSTLIDKLIVEHLYNPMTHIVNNAVTHGIETPAEREKIGKPPTGSIVIDAFLQGNQTVITVSDDGAGIDPEKIKAKAIEKGLVTAEVAETLSQQDLYGFLFNAGFSTKDKADDFAGRGVGMDVVATDLKKIRGKVTIDSEVGKGTTFTIRLPLTLSISKALCCLNDHARIAFPMDGVEETKEYTPAEIQTDSEGRPCIPWQDGLLPLKPLEDLLSFNRKLNRSNIYTNLNQADDAISVVVLRSANYLLAVQVSQVLGEQEIVIKQIDGPIPKPIGIAGATILGDGSVMPIADVLEIIEIAQGRRSLNSSQDWWEAAGTVKPIVTEEQSQTKPLVLVVDDSITVRELLSLSFQKLDYRVEQARDGQEAWEKIRAGLPCDMIFCDIEMPKMNGLELLAQIQQDELLATIPVAMLTSRGAEKHRQLAAELGATAYLTKPYTEKELMDVAQKMLAGDVLLKNSTRKSSHVSAKTKDAFVEQIPEAETLIIPSPSELLKQEAEREAAASLTKNKHTTAFKPNPLVLIVDDSVTVRELLSMTFSKAGYRVEQARDGQQAWEKLTGGLACDVVICDIEMPRMNGLELLAHMQNDPVLAQIPVAMLTSRGAEKHRRMAADRGAKGYLTKPYLEEVLLDVSKRLMLGEVILEV